MLAPCCQGDDSAMLLLLTTDCRLQVLDNYMITSGIIMYSNMNNNAPGLR